MFHLLREARGQNFDKDGGGRDERRKRSITHFQIYPKDKIQPAAQKIQMRFEQGLLHGECGMLDA